MKIVRIFNPLHVMGKKIGLVDMDNMKLFKLSEHLYIRPRLDEMKIQISKYNALVQGIKSIDQLKDAECNETFVISDW